MWTSLPLLPCPRYEWEQLSRFLASQSTSSTSGQRGRMSRGLSLKVSVMYLPSIANQYGCTCATSTYSVYTCMGLLLSKLGIKIGLVIRFMETVVTEHWLGLEEGKMDGMGNTNTGSKPNSDMAQEKWLGWEAEHKPSVNETAACTHSYCISQCWTMCMSSDVHCTFILPIPYNLSIVDFTQPPFHTLYCMWLMGWRWRLSALLSVCVIYTDFI